MGTTADKLARLNETKALLKTRLTEKGLDVASEDNFYNLANKVGEIQNNTPIEYIKWTGTAGPMLQTEVLFVRDGVARKTYISPGGLSGDDPIFEKNSIFVVFSEGVVTVSGDATKLGSRLDTNVYFVTGECRIVAS